MQEKEEREHHIQNEYLTGLERKLREESLQGEHGVWMPLDDEEQDIAAYASLQLERDIVGYEPGLFGAIIPIYKEEGK